MEYVRISRTGINKTWREMQFPDLAWAQGIIQPQQQQQQLQLLSPCRDAGYPNLGVRGVSWHCIQCTLSRVLCVTCTPSTTNTPGSSAAAHPAPEMCAYWKCWCTTNSLKMPGRLWSPVSCACSRLSSCRSGLLAGSEAALLLFPVLIHVLDVMIKPSDKRRPVDSHKATTDFYMDY